MRILHIVPSYLPAYRYGGPIFSVHSMNKALVQAGAEITVYTTDADGTGSLEVPLGVPVDQDGVRVYYFPRSFPRAWYYSRALHRALRDHVREFDLVHITSVFLAASTLGAYYAKKFRKPYIISPRGSLMREPIAMKSVMKKHVYLSLVERRNLAGAAAIHFTVPVEEQEYIEATFPVPRGFVVPNCFDAAVSRVRRVPLDFRTAHDIPSDAPLILSAGRFSWKKGFDTLIPAFAAVRRDIPAAHLAILGVDDGYRATIEALVDEHGIRANTRIILLPRGMFGGDEEMAAFSAAQVFCLPSYSENFGGAILEAFWFGVPAVVTPGVGLADAVQEAGAGRVVEKNPAAVAHALRVLLRDPDAARGAGERGRTLLEASFSGTAVARAMLREYHALILNR